MLARLLKKSKRAKPSRVELALSWASEPWVFHPALIIIEGLLWFCQITTNGQCIIVFPTGCWWQLWLVDKTQKTQPKKNYWGVITWRRLQLPFDIRLGLAHLKSDTLLCRLSRRLIKNESWMRTTWLRRALSSMQVGFTYPMLQCYLFV
jgi:hypothetical protein